MTKWRSKRSIYNKNETEVLPGAKFVFDDQDWNNVNCHADLPNEARHELESAIYLHLVFRLQVWKTKQRKIKKEFMSLAKKANALCTEFENLSGVGINMGDPILNKHRAAVAEARDWAEKMVLAWGRDHPNNDPSARNRLIRDAAKIYNGYAKTPLKEFQDKYKFIGALLEIAGINKNERAIELEIQACCKQNWLFFRRQNKTIIISGPEKPSNSD